MQAIDDYANENVARSIAYTVLEHRQQHNYSALLPLASRLLTQRIRFLGPPKTDNDAKEWDPLVQWQEDTCPQVIDSLWQSEEYQDKIYEQPVYYKRLDAETLHCVVEFAAKEGMRYAVVLVLEEGTGDISELKYHNTKAFTEKEWQQEIVKGGWSRSMEQAERAFIRIPGSSPPSPQDTDSNRNAPDDYWGDWSSDEEDRGEDEDRAGASRSMSAQDVAAKDEDSEDEYFARWSQDPPGTLTPGLPEDRNTTATSSKSSPDQQAPGSRTLQPYYVFQALDAQYRSTTERQEIQEEYDQSYNPLYTVPSVPNLMDLHHSALAELTQMLQTSLPDQRSSAPPTSFLDPRPKVLRLREEQERGSNGERSVPGAQEESSKDMTVTEKRRSSWERETGRMLLMKSLRALISVAKLLGFQDSDILDMVQEIVNPPPQYGACT